MKRRLVALMLTVLLALSMSGGVSAHQVPDLSQNGTITFQIMWEGEPVEGGTLQMYRVGRIVEEDGNYAFALVEELAGSGLSLENPDDPALASSLSELPELAQLQAVTAPVEAGEVVFEDVAPGLYLVVQPEACTGFAQISPFLISMPRFENGVYVMDVVARPKVPLEPTPPTTPTTPTPPPPGLPQTGQLNWPVPLMAAVGLGLFAIGWVLCFGRKRD